MSEVAFTCSDCRRRNVVRGMRPLVCAGCRAPWPRRVLGESDLRACREYEIAMRRKWTPRRYHDRFLPAWAKERSETETTKEHDHAT